MTFNTEPIWDGSGLIPFDPSGEYIYEIQAIFQVDPNYKKTYTITALSQDDSKGTVTGGGTYEEGSQATLTATGKTGYSFSVWDDGETANPRVITVTKDATYTAIFSENVEKPKYTITVVSADEAQGTVTGGGEFDEYSTITIQATPKDGYDFDKWQDGNTENPRKVTVTENMTFTAYFKAQSGPAKQFTITVVSSNPSAGSVLGGGTYDEGSTIQIAAVPNEGYVFTMWNDENKDNPRNITVTADAIYVANFGPATGLENISLETEGTRKVMVEGNIYIIKDGKMYNILGTRVK